MITVRPAGPADATAMSAVLIASIRDLCTADHRNDPEILAGWLRNKTPEMVRKMLDNPNASCSSPSTTARSPPSAASMAPTRSASTT